MDINNFIPECKEAVMNYTNQRLNSLNPTDDKQITIDDVYVVWFSKTLQNAKALLSTTLFDGMYYELTYNGNKDEIYFDAYEKIENRVFDCSSERGE